MKTWALVMALSSTALAALFAGVVGAIMLPPGPTPDALESARTPEHHRAIADARATEAEDFRAQAMAPRRMPQAAARKAN